MIIGTYVNCRLAPVTWWICLHGLSARSACHDVGKKILRFSRLRRLALRRAKYMLRRPECSLVNDRRPFSVDKFAVDSHLADICDARSDSRDLPTIPFSARRGGNLAFFCSRL